MTVQGVVPQLSFGPYTFPITFQETSRLVTLAFDKKKVPFGWGESVAPNTSPSARVIEISGPVGSLITGSAGNVLSTAADLEAERRLLAGLQSQGRLPLYVGTQQYILAYLESFEHKLWQDAFGFRYADWTLKFYADDPRYVSVSPQTLSYPLESGTVEYIPINPLGNVRAYPSCTFVSAWTSGSPQTGPFIQVTNGANTATCRVTFSKLSMTNGSTLAINCDPRPNARSAAAIYTPLGGAPQNALQYCAITDFQNDYDLSEWFPFFNPPQVETGIQFAFGFVAASGNYAFHASWNDQWL